MRFLPQNNKNNLAIIDKIYSRTNITSDPEDCWLWQGSRTKQGYGEIRINDKTKNTHRVIFEVLKGKIPKNYIIKTICGNYGCINLDHLIAKKRNRAIIKRNERKKPRLLKETNFVLTTKNIFFKNVLLPNENGCMEWKNLKINTYGRIKYNNKSGLAHRFSYELFVGKIPENMCVLHKCDNRKCVAPDHLFLGTIADNDRDRDLKNRQCRGEKQWGAKLTEKDVKEIKIKLKNGMSHSKIAKQYNVTKQAITRISTNKNWRYINV